jgi:serine O-acetyltransferase
MFENIHQDLKVSCGDNFSLKKVFLSLFASTEFRSVLWYRINKYFYQRKLKFLAYYFSYRAKKIYGIEISSSAEIGSGFRIVHGLGTVIGNGVRIGKNVVVYQQVTIGTVNPQKGGIAYPYIEDDVIIYAGAKVLGGIRIGKNSVVAANAVVITDIPPFCLAAGVPARVVKEFDQSVENWVSKKL